MCPPLVCVEQPGGVPILVQRSAADCRRGTRSSASLRHRFPRPARRWSRPGPAAARPPANLGPALALTRNSSSRLRPFPSVLGGAAAILSPPGPPLARVPAAGSSRARSGRGTGLASGALRQLGYGGPWPCGRTWAEARCAYVWGAAGAAVCGDVLPSPPSRKWRRTALGGSMPDPAGPAAARCCA